MHHRSDGSAAIRLDSAALRLPAVRGPGGRVRSAERFDHRRFHALRGSARQVGAGFKRRRGRRRCRASSGAPASGRAGVRLGGRRRRRPSGVGNRGRGRVGSRCRYPARRRGWRRPPRRHTTEARVCGGSRCPSGCSGRPGKRLPRRHTTEARVCGGSRCPSGCSGRPGKRLRRGDLGLGGRSPLSRRMYAPGVAVPAAGAAGTSLGDRRQTTRNSRRGGTLRTVAATRSGRGGAVP